MNRKMTSLTLTAFLFLVLVADIAHSQDVRNKWGFGLNVGGERLYGDRTDVSAGVGFEGLVTYRILDFAELAFALGYSQLKYTPVPPSVFKTTDIINADIKGNFEILSEGQFRPYLSLGIGMINSHVFNSGKGRTFDANFFGGGGFKFRFSRQWDWLIGADYRFTTTDRLDNIIDEGKSNDGFLNIRTGVTYHLSSGEGDVSFIVAGQRAPFYEVDSEQAPEESGGYYSTGADRETKDMEEYVRLKSRVDDLAQSVDSKEKEIANLQSQLNQKKQKVSYMKQRAARKSPASIRTSSSMSGFSDIYEEALTHFYNKQYSEAISLLQLLLDKYPNHSLVSNCQYWIGESYLAMGRFQESIDAFYKVLSFPRSLKKDDSLFQLGKAFLKIGAGEKARESFARLIREYPNSEFVEEAKTYLGKL